MKKRNFKPPDQVLHNYDRRPFHLDGRVNLDVEFLDKTMTTPVYVKKYAHEQLLLSEGVCRQLGIISYHPEVQTSPPKKENENGPSLSDNSPTPCQVPSVKVHLVQSAKLPPNHSAVVEARLVGDTEFSQGPLLLEGIDGPRNEMGLQLVDEFVSYLTITRMLKFSLPTPRELPNEWKRTPKLELPYQVR